MNHVEISARSVGQRLTIVVAVLALFWSRPQGRRARKTL